MNFKQSALRGCPNVHLGLGLEKSSIRGQLEQLAQLAALSLAIFGRPTTEQTAQRTDDLRNRDACQLGRLNCQLGRLNCQLGQLGRYSKNACFVNVHTAMASESNNIAPILT